MDTECENSAVYTHFDLTRNISLIYCKKVKIES
jgi:hypothetical protein